MLITMVLGVLAALSTLGVYFGYLRQFRYTWEKGVPSDQSKVMLRFAWLTYVSWTIWGIVRTPTDWPRSAAMLIGTGILPIMFLQTRIPRPTVKQALWALGAPLLFVATLSVLVVCTFDKKQHYEEVVALVASIITLCTIFMGQFDQILKNWEMIRRRKIPVISIWMPSAVLFGCVLWLLYGARIGDKNLVLIQSCGATFSGIIVAQLFYARRRGKTD